MGVSQDEAPKFRGILRFQINRDRSYEIICHDLCFWKVKTTLIPIL